LRLLIKPFERADRRVLVRPEVHLQVALQGHQALRGAAELFEALRECGVVVVDGIAERACFLVARHGGLLDLARRSSPIRGCVARSALVTQRQADTIAEHAVQEARSAQEAISAVWQKSAAHHVVIGSIFVA
jgi:hypothetical protein